MSIIYARGLWGMPDGSLDEQCQRIADAGFDAVEAFIPLGDIGWQASFAQAAERHGLRLLPSFTRAATMRHAWAVRKMPLTALLNSTKKQHSSIRWPAIGMQALIMSPIHLITRSLHVSMINPSSMDYDLCLRPTEDDPLGMRVQRRSSSIIFQTCDCVPIFLIGAARIVT